jgi:hypothetical protein
MTYGGKFTNNYRGPLFIESEAVTGYCATHCEKLVQPFVLT